MNKKLFKRAVAFAVASLMAVGVINVLPEEYFPHIGVVVSAEETDGVAIDTVNFPDDIFRQYISDRFDTDKDGFLSDWEISQNIPIDLNESGVQSLKGIEFFTELTYLSCYGNQLTSLDISNNTALTDLICFNNQLTSLDISNNTALTFLWCDNNQLTSLDVSNNTALTYLRCSDNQLVSLDVNNNIALTSLISDNNQLTSLDVSNNTALEELVIGDNLLTSLDVSNNATLNHLACNDNQIASLDVSQNIALKNLSCNGNLLTSIGVSNNTALTNLFCSDNPLKSLDVSNNTALEELAAENNLLTTLDVGNNTKLTELICQKNSLTSLDVSNNTALVLLWCGENQLTTLDVSNSPALESLTCSNNMLTKLDVSNNPALDLLWFGYNQLTSLDLSNSPLITHFDWSCNAYDIGEICGAYDLKNLPAGFDITKASNWSGATLEDGKLTGINGSGQIAYNYDCGNGQTAVFSLTYTLVDHSYDDGVITTEPSEQSEGEKTYTCTNCGATKTEVIEKLDHIHNKGDELISDETGHWYTCDGCDEKLDFATHTEDNGTVTVEPTETAEGQKEYKCTVCGHITRTDVVAKLDHVHNKGDELVSDETGHWYTCDGCDEKLDFATHTEDNGTVTVEPTVNTEGQKVYKCTVCGYTTGTETIAKLEGGNNNPTKPSRPSQPSEPSNPPQQPETNGSETNISVKKGWGNVVKEIDKANDNSKINVDMGSSTEVPKNVINAIKGKNVDIVLDMGDGITWTINGQDVTDPQSVDFSVTKKKNQIPEDMISDPSNTIPLVLAHNGNFGCSATLSIDLKDNDNKVANLYYYNTKTKELEFVDSSVVVNGKANLVFTHASDWAIVISDTSAAYEDVSSATGVYETDDNSQAPLCIIVIILTALGFSYIIITKRLTKHKR